MARVKGGFVTRRRRKKLLKANAGYYGSRKLLWKKSHEAWMHAGQYAFRDRRNRKRDLRRLWIARIKVHAFILTPSKNIYSTCRAVSTTRQEVSTTATVVFQKPRRDTAHRFVARSSISWISVRNIDPLGAAAASSFLMRSCSWTRSKKTNCSAKHDVPFPFCSVPLPYPIPHSSIPKEIFCRDFLWDSKLPHGSVQLIHVKSS
ncbi:MAG: 50S ribosomal protein L20, partial [Chloroflexi bacterium]|nr:50S ribosomal protein L20 [Chloroflexota bacterium]